MWFIMIAFVLLVGFTLVGLTLRHWYVEYRKKAENNEASLQG